MPLYNPTASSDATLTFTDITTNNSSTSKHGFLKKLDNDNTHFMDGTGAWSAPASAPSNAIAHACRATRASGNFSVGNNTYTAIDFNAEDLDTDTMHDNSTNPSRITIPTVSGVTTGFWAIKASGYTDTPGNGRTDCKFRINGTTDIAFTLIPILVTDSVCGYVLATDYVFTAADYVECMVRTTGGSGNVVYDASGSPLFSVAFLGKVT